MAVTLTGTNFVVGATTVAVAGGGVTVNNVVVGSSTSLTASFVLDLAARWCPHGDGHDGRRDERTANLHDQSAAARFPTFVFTGGPQTFTVPAGVVSITILATGAQGGLGVWGYRRRGWPGRSDDGDRVRHAGRVAHRACRWRGPRWLR